MKIVPLAFILFVVELLTGCLTIDEQLNSLDPAMRARAERRLESIALDTNEWTGGAEKDERIAAIKRIKSQDSLLRIATTDLKDGRFNGSYWDSVFRANQAVYGPLIDKMDQTHLVAFILEEEQYRSEEDRPFFFYRRSKFNHDEETESSSAELFLSVDPVGFDSAESAIEYVKYHRRGDSFSPRLWYAILKLSDPNATAACFAKSINSQVKMVLFPKAFQSWQCIQNKYALAAILKIACHRQVYKQNELNRGGKNRLRRLDEQYVVTDEIKNGIVAKINDPKLYVEMLKEDSKFFVGDFGVIMAIAPKLSESRVLELAKKSMSEHSVRLRKVHYMNAFFLTYAAFKRTKEVGIKQILVARTVEKLNEDRRMLSILGSEDWEQSKEQVRNVIEVWGSDLPADIRSELERLYDIRQSTSNNMQSKVNGFVIQDLEEIRLGNKELLKGELVDVGERIC